MTRSRQRERERIRAPVDTTDAGALVGWAYSLRPLLVDLRELAEDATAPPAQRVCSRLYLRKQLLRALRELDARIAVVAPPLPFSVPPGD